MKRWLKWIVAVLVIAVIAAAVLRAVGARKAQQAAAAAETVVKAQSLVELANSDVFTARTRELQQGLPISGPLRAANSAFVKARVAGELLGLTVREGDAVKAGQQLARVDSAEYEARVNQALRQADAARSQIDIAQRQYDNNKALVDQGFISRTALDTSLATLESAQASHKAAMAGVDVTRKSLDDTLLRAPISGVVAQRLAQPGERVGVDAKVVEIVDLSRLELEASLGAADSLLVQVGQTAALQVEGTATPFTARVVRINPSAQAGSRAVLAYLNLDNPAGLRQGLFAQGTLGTSRTSALAVPVSAVRTDKPLPYVQVVEGSKIAHRTVVPGVRGEADNQPMVAVTGLADNAVVLAGSVGSLREGIAVKFTGPAPAAR
jgi:RND family efflux transporter MFP subunit